MRSLPSYIGLDFGNASIKLVELRATSGVPELATYASATLPVPTGAGPRAYSTAELAATVKELMVRSKASSRRVYGALPTESVFTSIISVPHGNTKAIAAAVLTEAAKLLPKPVDEMVLDPQQISISPDKRSVRVLLVAAPRDVVERYDAICRAAGIELLGLETESFSMIRSLIGKDVSPVALVDFGAFTTDIVIVSGGIPVIARSVRIGGNDITTALKNVLGVDVVTAEQAKLDTGLSSGKQPVPDRYRRILDPILHELRYTLDMYTEQSQRRVEKIILSGGSSLLGGFASYVGTTTGVRTFIGNPWSRVRYPLELEKTLASNAGQFSVALGLALRPFKS